MSVSQVIDTVLKPELENVFGPALSARIIISARAKANAPIVGMKKEDLERMIEALGDDDRVLGMWGVAGAQERLRRWREALKKAGF